jgi:hypothetical protein
MDNKYIISDYSIIGKGVVKTDRGRFEFPYEDDDGKFFKNIYKRLEIDYPKFYKMDRLSKLAFLTAEYLLKDKNLPEKYAPDEVAMIFSNSNSSLDTDIKHNNSILSKDKYFPKPAVFVYTLPNILMGEISIRHIIRGENTFFITEKFDTVFFADYVINLLNKTKHKACLLGRADYMEGEFESVLFLIEQSNNAPKERLMTGDNLMRLLD